MDLHGCTPTTAAAPAAQRAGVGTGVPVQARVLADALAHLLARDDDRPARWRTSSFVVAVERARAELGGVGTVWDLPATPNELASPIAFDEAVARIARNPDDVAVAIRCLELGARTPLPVWPDVVRRGLPTRPTDPDTALWFG